MKKKTLIPTSEEIKANAENTYAQFQSANILRRLGIGPKGTYFYVFGWTPEGKAVCWGPMPDGLQEALAASKGLVEGEVFEMDTRDLTRAKQEIKAELMRRGMNPDKALKRMSSKQEKEEENQGGN